MLRPVNLNEKSPSSKKLDKSPSKTPSAQQQAQPKSKDGSAKKSTDLKVVESLKQEWSFMFNKLENDYKQKLEEQQKLNDLKLEEIKKSILENQEQLIIKQYNNAVNNATAGVSSNLNRSEEDLKSTFTISKVQQQRTHSPPSSSSSSGVATEPINACLPKKSASNASLVDSVASTSACSASQTNSIVENAKYISNLRLELKSKHARHVQDLRDYYEKEIEELKKQLEKNEDSTTTGGEPNAISDKIISSIQQKNAEQVNLNAELKNTNNSLLAKLVCQFCSCWQSKIKYQLININLLN